MTRQLRIVVCGLSLSSSWGNGHATTYRALLSALAKRGHDVLFFERDQPWYAAHRDLPVPDFCRLVLYRDVAALEEHRAAIAGADAVLVGSYVPDGVAVGRFVQRTARGIRVFYDIDTPVTLAKLERGDFEYLSADLIPGYDLYFSFTGGPTLDLLMRRYGSPLALPLYCSVDPDLYRPLDLPRRFDLGYLGTYSPDRQPALERLLIEPARQASHLRFVIAGPLYPKEMDLPANVERIDHVAPADHAAFYSACRFTLNVTRRDMIRAGYSPSVRLFEAAACGTPIISDFWPGLDGFFHPGREILLARSADEVLSLLTRPEDGDAQAIGGAARARVLAEHSADRRAAEFEAHLQRAPLARAPPSLSERQKNMNQQAFQAFG